VGDGTYILTADTIYTGPGGSVGPTGVVNASALKIQGNTFEVVRNGQTFSGTFTTQSTTLTLNIQCPGATTTPAQFTATAGALKIYDDDQSNIDTYTKQ
jgi:hypothetical protein